MRLACVVVLYNPIEDELFDNISSYIDEVSRVYCVDNSDKLWNKDILRKLGDKVIYISNGGNKGVSCALNTGCNTARENGFDYVLLMDQDSFYFKNGLTNLKSTIADTKRDYSMYVPVLKAIYRDGYKRVDSDDYILRDNSTHEVEYAITSGSILSLDIYEKLGGYDENLFLYGVDREFCCRINIFGGRILQVGTAEMYHEAGRTEVVKLFGKAMHIPNLTPSGYYFTFLGEAYNRKKLGKEYDSIKAKIYKNVISIIFFEGTKKAKLIHCFKGYKQGLLLAKGINL